MEKRFYVSNADTFQISSWLRNNEDQSETLLANIDYATVPRQILITKEWVKHFRASTYFFFYTLRSGTVMVLPSQLSIMKQHCFRCIVAYVLQLDRDWFENMGRHVADNRFNIKSPFHRNCKGLSSDGADEPDRHGFKTSRKRQREEQLL